MKNTSTTRAVVHSDITLIQSALADMTIAEFIELPVDKLRHLATLLEIAQQDEAFLVNFPKKAVLEYHLHFHRLGRAVSAYAASLQGEDAYADWCCKKLRQRIESLRYKFLQMLESKTLRATELSAEQMQIYQRLYDVVSDSGKSLVDVHLALAETERQRQQQ